MCACLCGRGGLAGDVVAASELSFDAGVVVVAAVTSRLVGDVVAAGTSSLDGDVVAAV